MGGTGLSFKPEFETFSISMNLRTVFDNFTNTELEFLLLSWSFNHHNSLKLFFCSYKAYLNT